MKLKLFLFSIFVLLSLVAYKQYRDFSTLKSDDTVLPINTYSDCGEYASRTKFYIQPPIGWHIVISPQSDTWTREYRIVSPDQNQYLEISCGLGYGGGGYPKEDKTIIIIANQQVESFIHKNANNNLSKIGLTYLTTKNITYSFSGQLERIYLDQILSTFKFTD